MSDLVLNALHRNLETATKAGDTAWRERIEKRIAQEMNPGRKPAPAPPPDEVDEESEPDDDDAVLDALREKATELGVKVDGRWGADRLREEIDNAHDADPKED